MGGRLGIEGWGKAGGEGGGGLVGRRGELILCKAVVGLQYAPASHHAGTKHVGFPPTR